MSVRSAIRTGVSADRGMSLVEVVVAISILGILATAALGLYVSSMNASKSHQHREIAITVANQAMEFAAATTTSSLTVGRQKSQVETRWAAASSVKGISATYPLWDAGADGASIPTVPFSTTSTFNGTDFTAETFIGRCYQLRSTVSLAAGADCTRVSGYPTVAPSTTPSNMTQLLRVIVVVRWTADDGCSTPGACSYDVSTLIDQNVDREWIKVVP